mmetsp:Transcript_78660/g.163558  ORF Transcript_78660/g.163558 Transcript_78660/m.163558 type:complete len:319 (+) Transcript_78660:871-1827(+)
MSITFSRMAFSSLFPCPTGFGCFFHLWHNWFVGTRNSAARAVRSRPHHLWSLSKGLPREFLCSQSVARPRARARRQMRQAKAHMPASCLSAGSLLSSCPTACCRSSPSSGRPVAMKSPLIIREERETKAMSKAKERQRRFGSQLVAFVDIVSIKILKSSSNNCLVLVALLTKSFISTTSVAIVSGSLKSSMPPRSSPKTSSKSFSSSPPMPPPRPPNEGCEPPPPPFGGASGTFGCAGVVAGGGSCSWEGVNFVSLGADDSAGASSCDSPLLALRSSFSFDLLLIFFAKACHSSSSSLSGRSRFCCSPSPAMIDGYFV